MGGLFGGLFSLFGFAHGGAFLRGRVQPFARGGVVRRPTLFPMARGLGLMGEAGPEAVMPLTRLPGGDLGVKAGASAPVVNMPVTIINETGVQARAETRQERGPAGDIRTYVRLVAQHIAGEDLPRRGPVAQSLERNYGLNRQVW